ncbi:MAG: 4-alpha-glucanotransferase [Nevskiales bacterium]|nr:4-alpha-glucanotransferase [Nevskiales bacterium]
MNVQIPRSAGVLLHVTSLPPGPLLDTADRFGVWLATAGFRVWQILPLGPTDPHGSPYQPNSGFAGHAPLFEDAPDPSAEEVARFAADNVDWLEDYALFLALSAEHDQAGWPSWPVPLRDRAPAALDAARRRHAAAITRVVHEQCRFERNWQALKQRLNARGIRIFGDVPLFLAHNSADVWAHRSLFELTDDGQCESFMGVPPDAFSDDGQWWGYPPYRWSAMAESGYAWWKRRFEIQARRFDLVRIDHFRGLVAFWRIPHQAESARDGSWVPGPGRGCIDALAPVLEGTQLVAEDLGYITDDVVETRHQLGLPGMRVLQFAFDGDPDNPHLPRCHLPDTVCYTGTHDNDTTLGWWQRLDANARAVVARTLGQDDPVMPQALVEFGWSSPGFLSMTPLQDLIGLGSEARMNVPGTVDNNWQWRFDWTQIGADMATTIRQHLIRHDRYPL